MSENKEDDLGIDLPFELIIGDAGGRIDNGDVPIRWCASPNFIQELEAKGVKDPHVLIASYHNSNVEGRSFNYEMDRKLIPISELMTYLRFTRSGKCKVYGMIVDGAVGRAQIHKKWMRRAYGVYDDIVDSWNDRLHDGLDYVVVSTSEFVEIPEGVFGKEPSPWVKWYVNLWHDSKSKITDECDFRKRFLIAFIFKWIVFLPYLFGLVFLRVVGGSVAILGGFFTKVKFWRVFRPYKYPNMQYNVLGDINGISDNSFFFERRKINGSNYRQTTPIMCVLAFIPLLLITEAVLVSFIVTLRGDFGGDFGAIMAAIAGGVFGLLLFIDLTIILVELGVKYKFGNRLINAIDGFIMGVLARFPKFNAGSQGVKVFVLSIAGLLILAVLVLMFKFLLAAVGIIIVSTLLGAGFFFLMLVFADKILALLDNFFAMSAKDNDYSHITELLCAKEEDNLRPNYKYIPKKQRTVRLWYRDLKNKVCKPMQS